MYLKILFGILLPFIGTTLGAFCVYFIKKEFNLRLIHILNGFAAGVMIAASIWSLLIPAMEYESSLALEKFAFLPALLGMWLGIGFMFLIEKFIPSPDSENLLKKNMLFWSVTLHNLPEGMAVGVIYASLLENNSPHLLSVAFALSIGIAIQNFPEGAIISMPLYSKGMSKNKSFLLGTLSGIIEPVGALITILAVSFILPFLPALLGFAAGAMIFAVLNELMPSITSKDSLNLGTVSFAIGFSCMMMLDVALG